MSEKVSSMGEDAPYSTVETPSMGEKGAYIKEKPPIGVRVAAAAEMPARHHNAWFIPQLS